jgi:hypothetical protein
MRTDVTYIDMIFTPFLDTKLKTFYTHFSNRQCEQKEIKQFIDYLMPMYHFEF